MIFDLFPDIALWRRQSDDGKAQPKFARMRHRLRQGTAREIHIDAQPDAVATLCAFDITRQTSLKAIF